MPDSVPKTLTSLVLDTKNRYVDITWIGGSQKYTGSGGICSDDYANVETVIGSIGKCEEPRLLVLGDQSYLINKDTDGKIL